ncbi:stalk domain-containing protein [Paenibacillus thalictri]|nr:stalk domain-containing protein [Paenibacillus thalictri]
MFIRGLWRKKIAALLLSATILVLSGCQAIGGLDVGKALAGTYSIKSYEGKSVIVLDLVPGSKIPESSMEQKLLKLLQHIEIHQDTVKMENQTTASAAGRIIIAERTIPFQLHIMPERLTISIEGIKKPIVIDLASAEEEGALPELVKELQAKLQASPFLDNLRSYLFKQLPNPGKISVESAVEKINGERVSLHKLHGELTAKEVIPLLKTFVTNVLKDDKELRDLIGQMYDVFYPVLAPKLEEWKQSMQTSGTDEDSSLTERLSDAPLVGAMADKLPSVANILDILKDRERTIEVVHAQAKQLASFALMASYSVNESQLQQLPLMNDQTYLAADMYFDDALKLRKSSTTLAVSSLEAVTDGVLSSAKMTATGEIWNLNNFINAEPVNTAQGALQIGKNTDFNPIELLQNMDPSSQLFLLLTKDLELGLNPISNSNSKSKPFSVILEDSFKPGLGKPFLKEGVTMVPLSFISSRLGANVSLDDKMNLATITEPATSKTIVLTADSRTAVVDGEELKMDQAAFVDSASFYVPLTFIVNQFGGNVEWDEATHSVWVTMQ